MPVVMAACGSVITMALRCPEDMASQVPPESLALTTFLLTPMHYSPMHELHVEGAYYRQVICVD